MSAFATKIGEFYRNLVTADLKRRLDSSSDVFLLNYQKMLSADMTQLRKNLKSVGATMLVTKNSFMRRVFEDVHKPAEAGRMVDGPTALVFIKDDPIAVSKVIVAFIKDHEALKVQGGFLSDRLLNFNDVKRLSTIPSIQALYQQVASALQAPIGKLAMSLNQITAKLVYALSAVKDKKK